MKKIILLIVTFIVIALIAIGGYLFFVSQENDEPVLTSDDRGILFPIIDFLTGGENDELSPDDSFFGGEGSEDGAAQKKLHQVSKDAVSGLTFTNETGELVLRYVERATGHVYDYFATSSQIVRRSNTTVPRIQEAIFVTPNDLLLRYLANDDEIATFAAELISGMSTSSTEIIETGVLSGKFLEQNILSVAVSPEGNLFYLVPDGAGSIGIRSRGNGDDAVTIFRSPIREWSLEWPVAGTILLKTKPSATMPGIIYTLDSKSGALQKYFGGVNGLTSLVRSDLNTMLYGEGASLKLHQVKGNISQDLGVYSLPDKCVWSKTSLIYCGVPKVRSNALMPDAWFQGLVTFSDQILKIDTTSGKTVEMLSEETADSSFDITQPTIYEDMYFAFINKGDLSLWILEIPQDETVFPIDSTGTTD